MGDMMLQSRHYREDATGHILCWGCGEFGQHGHGYKKEVAFVDSALEQFCGLMEMRVKHVGCGSSHTVVVTNSNKLYVWGNGNSGQLGCNDLATKYEPQKIPLYSNQSLSPTIAGVACGGRHTMVWLENGHVFSFGNNFNAQLGYDFKKRNYKENQKKSDDFWDDTDENTNQYVTQPTLLKFLTHRPVAQVACGDKHTVLRFKDGGVACVGNNTNGQIGCANRAEAVVPKFLDDFNQQPIKFVAAGSQHSLAISESGEIYEWGYGKACGNKMEDVLSPIKLSTHRSNVVSVAGGSMHSMALTENGSVYTWGCGTDGQLGHGEKIRFLSYPRRVKDRHVNSKCIRISCGEMFSAAVTEKGLLYMWGKNSHTIVPGKPTSVKYYLPYGLNKNFRGGRIGSIHCGSWHAVAFIGRPELLLRDEEDSGESDEELVPSKDDLDMEPEEELDAAVHLEESDSNSEPEAISRKLRREETKLEREKTTVSIADFYAPTPDINKNYRSPSPEFYFTNNSEDSNNNDRTNLNSTRSAGKLIVQLPVQPLMTYADAATSPMTLTTTSSNKSSSVTTLSRVPSPVQGMPPSARNMKISRKGTRPEKKFKEFDPQKYERERLRNPTPVVSEVVQVSKTPADAFFLPHEPTGLSKKHVDFSEMEEIRLKGPRSPEKLSRLSKHRDIRDLPSPLKSSRDLSPVKRDGNPSQSKSKMRHMDSSCSFKSDSALLESPLFRGSKNMVDLSKRPWNVAAYSLEEERQYKHHVPKQPPRKYIKPKQSESNFGLQISRSKTVIAPLYSDVIDPSDRLAQLRRYASMHNPKSNSDRGVTDKLRPLKPRHVSIPTGRADSPAEDIEQLCVGSVVHSPVKPTFSSGSTWRDRSDNEAMQPRKVAAGIVRMYISNNELVGAVENPLYSNLGDGRGHCEPLLDGDSGLIVQPLLKKPIKLPDETVSIELPSIAIKNKSTDALKEDVRRSDSIFLDNDDLPLSIGNTPRADNMIDSRVS